MRGFAALLAHPFNDDDIALSDGLGQQGLDLVVLVALCHIATKRQQAFTVGLNVLLV